MSRRRRKSRTAILAEATIKAIKQKERTFLREVSGILTDALGFPVKVSHVKTFDAKGTPRMEKFRRLSKAEARKQMGDFYSPEVHPRTAAPPPGLDDDIPF